VNRKMKFVEKNLGLFSLFYWRRKQKVENIQLTQA